LEKTEYSRGCCAICRSDNIVDAWEPLVGDYLYCEEHRYLLRCLNSIRRQVFNEVARKGPLPKEHYLSEMLEDLYCKMEAEIQKYIYRKENSDVLVAFKE
jgi:hypothetical protein